MARTPATVGKWLRLVWLSLWAASLVAVIAVTAITIYSSRRITPGAVMLIVAASTVLTVVVERMGLTPRRQE